MAFFTNVGNEGIYSMSEAVKGKKVTLKNPPGRESRGYLTGRSYLRNTREIDSLTRLFGFQSCASQMPFSRETFS